MHIENKRVIHKGDFISIDFTGRIKNGEIFDSTLEEELKKLHYGHEHEIIAEPFTFCLGHGMFLESLENFLIGKEIGKWYETELPPEQAFGLRIPSLVQRVPMEVFANQNINPSPGSIFNFDGRIGKVLTVSGGRVIVDFNHVLSGKTLIYKIKIIRKINDVEEKIKALNKYFFKKNFNFQINEKNIILEVQKPFLDIVGSFKDKFKEILGVDIEIKEIQDITKNKKTQ